METAALICSSVGFLAALYYYTEATEARREVKSWLDWADEANAELKEIEKLRAILADIGRFASVLHFRRDRLYSVLQFRTKEGKMNGQAIVPQSLLRLAEQHKE